MTDEKGPEQKPKEKEMTPEEKLFQVISQGSREQEPAETGQPPQDLLETDLFSKIEARVERFKTFIRTQLGRLFKGFGSGVEGFAKKSDLSVHHLADLVQIKAVNRGLTALVAALCLYLVIDFIFLRVHPTPVEGTGGQTPLMSLSGSSAMQKRPEVGPYLERAVKRNIFLPYVPLAPAAAPQPSAPQQTAPAGTPVVPAPSNYQLVGISWDDEELVAMIESDPERGASFARKGDKLEDGVVVEDITEYVVILSKDGQKWELQ